MQNEQTIFFKEEFTWHYISLYLDCLKGIVAQNDEEYLRLLGQLRDYVDDKITPDIGGDVVDICVMVERKIK